MTDRRPAWLAAAIVAAALVGPAASGLAPLPPVPAPPPLQQDAGNDTEPPQITAVEPAPGSTVDPRPRISARYRDNGTGVDASAVEIRLDGINVTDRADRTASRAAYTPTDDLDAGEHSVTVKVSDGAGQTASRSWVFEVQTARTSNLQIIVVGILAVIAFAGAVSWYVLVHQDGS